MRTIGFLILSTALLVLFLACGGSGASPSTPAAPSHPPNLSGLLLSPQVSTQGAGGGTVNVVGLFTFADGGGDLSGLTLTCYTPAGAVAATATGPIPGGAATKAGTATLQLDLSTAWSATSGSKPAPPTLWGGNQTP